MANTPSAKLNKKARMIYAAECYRNGMGNVAIIKHMMEKFGKSEHTVRNDCNAALKWLSSYDDCDFIKDVRAKQVARAELLLENAIAEKRWSVANSIIDTLNKTLGIYENKQKVEITSNEIQFKFGGTNNIEENDEVSE